MLKSSEFNEVQAAGDGIFAISVVPDQPSYLAGEMVGWTINYSCSASSGGPSDTCDDIVITMPRPSFMATSGGTIAGSVSTVSNVFTGSGQALAVWTFVSSIPAGASGQLHVNWTSSSGTTPNNSIVTATASVREGSATGPVLLTADASATLTAEATFIGFKYPNTTLPIVVGEEYTYKLGLRYSGTSNGRLHLQNVIYVDQLPPTAIYVSSSDGGVYNPVTHTVTWPIISSINAGYTSLDANYNSDRYVTVRYDATDNADGEVVTNTFLWSGNGFGDSNDLKSGTADRTNTITYDKVPGQALSKTVYSRTGSYALQALHPIGGRADWRLIVSNTGNVKLSGTIRDVIPCADNTAATSYISDTAIDFGQPPACNVPATIATLLNFNPFGTLKPGGGSTYTKIRWWANDGSSGTYTTPDPEAPPTSRTMAQLGLATGTQLIAFEVDYQIDGNPNKNSSSNYRFEVLVNSTSSLTLKHDDWARNIMQVKATAGGQNFAATDYATLYLRQALPFIRAAIANQEGDGVVYAPGRTITWRGVYSSLTATGGDGMPAQPDWYMVIPSALRYVEGSLEFLNLPVGLGKPQLVETYERTWGTLNHKYTILHLRWADGTELSPCQNTNMTASCTIEVSFQTLVIPGAADGTYNQEPTAVSAFKHIKTQGYAAGTTFTSGGGSCSGVSGGVMYNGINFGNQMIIPGQDEVCTMDSYDINSDGASTTITSYHHAPFIVGSYAVAFGDILVQGSENSSFASSGLTTAGGTNHYQMELTNASNENTELREMLFYASLPRPGDTYVSQTSGGGPRGSTTSVRLTGPVTAPSNVTVYYSTSDNPCRDEVYPNAANPGCSNTWVPASGVGNWADVKFLKFVVDGVYAPGEGETITFDAVTDTNVKSGDMAYMSIAFVATNDGSGVQLLPAEAPRVGLRVLGPSLQMAKTASPTSGTAVKSGDTIIYTITATNDGDIDLVGAKVADNLADVLDDATLVVGSPACSIGGTPCTAPVVSGNNLTWTGNLLVGETATLTYAVTVKPTATGTLNNSVQSTDEHAYCEEAGDCTTQHKVAALSVRKSANPASGTVVNRGGTITYTIEVENTGSANLAAATITDDVSGVLDNAVISTSSFTATSSKPGNTPSVLVPSGGTLNWTGPLEASEKVTLTYVATVNNNAYAVTLNNKVVGSAKVESGDTTNVPSNCVTGNETNCKTSHTTPAAAPSFTTVKTSNVGAGMVINQGSNIIYQVKLTNTGDAPVVATMQDDLTNVLLGATFVASSLSASSSIGGNTPPAPTFASSKVSWSGTLAVGEVVTISYSLTVKGDAYGEILTNSVKSSGTFDGDDIGSTCTAGTEPGCSVDVETRAGPALTITKTDSKTQLEAGDQTTYTITVTNTRSGSANATNVVVTDVLPANTAFVSATGSPTSTPIVGATGNVVWTIPTVAYGSPVTLTVTVKVNDSVTSGSNVVNNVSLTHPACADSSSSCSDSDENLVVPHDPTITISKTDGKTELQAGDQTTYTITVTNIRADSHPATAVVVTDALPSNATFVSATGSPTSTPAVGATGNVVWNISSVAYGSPVVLTVTIKVGDSVLSGNNIVNTATLTNVDCGVSGSVCTDSDTNLVVPQDPTLTITKTDSKTELEAGDQTTYTITVTNTRADSNPATGVTVIDTLPSASLVDYISSTGPGGGPGGTYNSTNHDVTWTIPSVAYGTPVTLTVTIKVKDTVLSSTSIVNSVTSNHSACSVTGANCSDSYDNTVIKHQPVLTVAKTTDGQAEVEAGEAITYTITITNIREDSFNATNVTVTDTLPSNVTFMSASDGGVESSGVVTWTIPSIAYGTPITRTVTVVVNDPEPAGNKVTNTVNLTHLACANTGSSCSDTEQSTVIPHDPTLVVNKTDYRTVVEAEDLVTYEITVTNTRSDSDPATSVTVTDTLPHNATFSSASDSGSASGGVVTWTVPSVAYGTPVKLYVTVVINDDVEEDDTVTNSVTLAHGLGCVQSGSSCSNSDTDIVILHEPDLLVGKDNGVDSVEAGTETTYTIAVTNTRAGSYPAINVVVTDILPDNVEFVSASDGGVENDGEVVWTIPSIEHGTPRYVTVTVRVVDSALSGDPIRNEASLSDDLCPVVELCVAVDEDVVAPHDPSLVITKTDGTDKVWVGDRLTYTLTIMNIVFDSNPAVDVVVTDILPAGLQFVSASGGGSYIPALHQVVWTIPEVNYGDPVILTITADVVVPAMPGTTLTNTATLDNDGCLADTAICTATDDNLVFALPLVPSTGLGVMANPAVWAGGAILIITQLVFGWCVVLGLWLGRYRRSMPKSSPNPLKTRQF